MVMSYVKAPVAQDKCRSPITVDASLDVLTDLVAQQEDDRATPSVIPTVAGPP
jgi:hypothetical protein